MEAADIIVAFIAAMEAVGMHSQDPIADRLGPDLIRFRCDGDGPGKANGWAVLHLDGVPAGAFGNYRMGISEKWRAGRSEPLSKETRRAQSQAIRQARERKESELSSRQRASAHASQERWAAAGSADPQHPYLVRKRLSGEGLKQQGGSLLVPMFDAQGRLWNVQSISPNGDKRFAKNGRQKGLFLVLGKPDSLICIGEGYATAAAVRRATGHAVAVAFSSANMLEVSRALRGLHAHADLVMLADDDAHLVDHPHIGRNIGLEAARAAAAAVGGRVAEPPREARRA